MFHTCGRVTDLVGDFVDAGLDILQSMQPGPMEDDFAKIKSEFGRDLCFQGGIDIQDVLPNGNPEDVRQHVKKWRKPWAMAAGIFSAQPIISCRILLQKTY